MVASSRCQLLAIDLRMLSEGLWHQRRLRLRDPAGPLRRGSLRLPALPLGPRLDAHGGLGRLAAESRGQRSRPAGWRRAGGRGGLRHPGGRTHGGRKAPPEIRLELRPRIVLFLDLIGNWSNFTSPEAEKAKIWSIKAQHVARPILVHVCISGGLRVLQRLKP